MITNTFTPSQREWIDELKTGKYKKSKQYLIRYSSKMALLKNENPIGFCCLGLRRHQLGQKPIRICYRNFDVGGFYYGVFRNYNSGELTHKQAAELKLLNVFGALKESVVVSGELIGSLACLNDNTNLSLKQIGLWIEKHPHLVFKNFDDSWLNNKHKKNNISLQNNSLA